MPEWPRKHYSFFEIDKLQLIYFTRKREKDPTRKGKTQTETRQQLVLVDGMVSPSPTHKLLGLILDQEIQFKNHTTHALAKGTEWTLQLWRLVKPTQCLAYQYTHQLYLSVVIPKMIYATDI